MSTKKSSATTAPNTPQKKTREVWHPVLTAERRAQNVALATAFLARFGRD